jgi:hypothetical protein
MTRTLLLAGAAALLLTASAQAQATATVDQLPCVPVAANAVVHGAASGEPAGGSVRLFFRWQGHDEFFWVDMEPEGPGRYFAIPPRPEQRNDEVEYYTSVVDAAGKELARSAPRVAKVTNDCKVQLSPREQGVANNLTVGETASHQQGKTVLGFLCEGIVTRVNWQGIRRADEVCRACVVAWWERKAVLIPATGVTGILIVDPDPEPSPSRP